tara:strand:- start:320 stop:601 length:282 start_codon:yes stop_codon:yes gene_type:complete
MGRAIDMEKDIDMLKREVKRLENIIRGMSSSINEMEDKSTKTTHIDLVDDVKEEDNSGEEKANDKGSSKSSGNAKSKHGNSKSKNTKSGKSSS